MYNELALNLAYLWNHLLLFIMLLLIYLDWYWIDIEYIDGYIIKLYIDIYEILDYILYLILYMIKITNVNW